MVLTKETVIDKIEILEDGSIQVREATYIVENGARITEPSYHRFALEPGSDVSKLGDRVKAVATTVWTKQVVDAHVARKAANPSPVSIPR